MIEELLLGAILAALLVPKARALWVSQRIARARRRKEASNAIR